MYGGSCVLGCARRLFSHSQCTMYASTDPRTLTGVLPRPTQQRSVDSEAVMPSHRPRPTASLIQLLPRHFAFPAYIIASDAARAFSRKSKPRLTTAASTLYPALAASKSACSALLVMNVDGAPDCGCE